MGRSIPWLAWFIVGLLVAAFSKGIDMATDARGLTIFFFIGILFMLVGVFKFLNLRRNKSKQSQAHSTSAHSAPTRAEHPVSHSVVYCHSCRAKNYSTFNFCHACGASLRRRS